MLRTRSHRSGSGGNGGTNTAGAGGDGGTNTAAAGNGGTGEGGAGGAGGAGGSLMVDAGTFNLSNTISGSSLANSAGINAVSQNTGMGSLVQQSVNVQANLTVQ
jgi:hypothetical protein